MKLLLGDCLELMKTIPAGSVDMVLCDLPYGTTACKWDAVIPFSLLWQSYGRICKPTAAIVITASQPFTSALVMSNLDHFRCEMIWKKERPTNPLLCKKQPPKYHENICIFYQKQPTYNPHRVKRDPKNKRNNAPREWADATKGKGGYAERVLSGSDDEIYASNVLEIPMQRGLHPTQKPVALMEYLIRTYTNAGETILDNTMGSGTTGVACANTGRDFIGIERDPEYFAIAEKRIREAELNNF